MPASPETEAERRLRLIREYQQWTAAGRPATIGQAIVTIVWPPEDDIGVESYLFPNEDVAMAWVGECENAAMLGVQHLDRAGYVVQPVVQPFDPRDLVPGDELKPVDEADVIARATHLARSNPSDSAQWMPGRSLPDRYVGLQRDVKMRSEGYLPAGDGQYITLRLDHDYALTYMIEGVHRTPRYARMGYLGTGMDMLQFSADPVAGVQKLRPEWILQAVDLGERSDATDRRRYVDSMKERTR